MKSLLPLTSRVEPTEDGAHVFSMADETADEVFKTLASSTARQILSLLYEEPRPAAELAEETETTVQNVRYHLENLQAAELISVADTWYSEKGSEMKVYAPTESALVLMAGQQSTTDRLKTTISNLLGAIGLFAAGSLLVQYLVTTYLRAESASATGSTSDTESVTMDAAETAAEEAGGGLAALLAEPGVIFFVGCLVALAVVAIWSTRR